MKKFISFVFIGILFFGLAEAKEPQWIDESVDFSTWKRVIVMELVDTEPQLLAEGIEDNLKTESTMIPEDENSIDQEKSKPTLRKTLDLTGANEVWKEQVPKKLKAKKIEVISTIDMLAYLNQKAPLENWNELWGTTDREKFFQKAAPFLESYADGFLIGQMLRMSEGQIYTPPSTRTESYNQGGTWRNGTYSPRMMTRTVTTPGYYSPSWQATGRFILKRLDGSSVWTYEKSSSKPQKGLFSSKKPSKFFEDFFNRALGESPIFLEKKPKNE